MARTTLLFNRVAEELEFRILLTPTISLPSAQTIDENAPLTLSASHAITVADSGASGSSDQVTLTAANGTLTLGSTPSSTTVTGNGTNTVVLSDTIANINTALNGLTYTPMSGFVGSDSIGVTIEDQGNSQSANASLGVTVVAPTITTTGGTTLNYTQGNSAAAIDPNLTLSDVSGTLTGATVAITSNLANNEDVLGFNNTTNITGTYNALTGVLTLSGSDTLADYQAALQSVTYQDASDDPSTVARTISFSFTDAFAGSNTASDNISVTAVNVPPTISIPSGSQTIGENTSLALSGANAIAVGDVDANGGTEQVTLSASDGTLTLGSTAGLSGSTGNGSGSVVFSGTLGSLNSALDGLTYAPNTGFSGQDTLQVSIDDEGNTGTGGPQTTDASLSVSVVAPAITVTGGTTLNYTEGNSAAAVDPHLTVTDGSGTVAGATVAITGNFAAGEDVLGFTNSTSITGAYDSATGVLTLSGTDTLADYQSALESVTYREVSTSPSTLTRSISFSFTDGFATSNTGVDQVTVTALSTPPPITIPNGSATIGENTSLILAGLNSIKVAGIDNAGGPDQVTLSAAHGTLTLGSTANVAVSGNGTGTVVVDGTLAELNGALDGLTYTPGTRYAGSDTLQVNFDDEANLGGPLSATGSVNITVVAPTVTVTGGTTLYYTQGNSAAVIDPAVSLGDFSGSVSGATVAITGNFAAGEDVLGFANTANITGSYDASTGVLTLSGTDTLADYEAALRSVKYQNTSDDPSTLARTVSFAFTDGFATSSPGTDTVSVTAVNLPPTITIPNGSESFGDNTTLVLSGANAISVADVDANGGIEQVTLSVSDGKLTLGSTAGLSSVTGNGTGSVVLSATIANLNTALNGLKYAADAAYVGQDVLQVGINDEGNTGTGGPQTATASMNITIVGPTVTTSGIPLAYIEGAPASIVDPFLTLSDPSGSVAGATVAITSNFAAGEDVLAFANTQNITGSYDASTGVLTLSGTDTLADYQAALRSVTYKDTSADPSPLARTISFSITDGFATSNVATDTVTVVAINGPPTIKLPSSPVQVEEDSTLVLSGGNAISVADAGSGVEQVTLSASDGTLTLNAIDGLTALSGNGTGSVAMSGTIANLNAALDGLTYTPNSGFIGHDSIQVSIDDEGNAGEGGAQTTNATLNVPVEVPTISVTGGTTLAYQEASGPEVIDSEITLSDAATTLTGATVAITGNFAADEDVLGFVNTAHISGSYNAATGVLTLSGSDSPADYQAALDSVTYEDTSSSPSTLARTISFSFADALESSNTAVDTVTVTAVTTPNSPPTIIAPATLSLAENWPQSFNSLISVGDLDGGLGAESVTLSASHGTFTLGTTSGLSGISGNGSGNLAFTGTLPSLNAAIAALTYTPANGYLGSDNIQVSIDDNGFSGTGGPQTTTATIAVTVSAPSISTMGGTTLDFTQSGVPAVIDLGVAINDAAPTISQATVSITGNFAPGEDVLGFTNRALITGSYDASMGVLTLSGTDTPVDYQAALESVTYQDTSLDPSTAARTISFTFSDPYASVNTATDNVTVTAINLPPTITAPSSVALGENWPQVFNGSISVADIDANGGVEELTLAAGHGTLTLATTSGLTSVTGNGTGSISFSGSIANLNAALDGLTYLPGSGYIGSDTIQIGINDEGNSGTGGPQTATASIGITVSASSISTTGGTTLAFTQSEAPAVIDSGVTLNDAAATIAQATVSITGNFAPGEDVLRFTNTATITGSYDAATGVLTLSGDDSPADYQAALRSVTYDDTSLDPSTATRTISFTFSDPYDSINTATDNVTVTAVNLPPTITLPATQQTPVDGSLVLSGGNAISVADVDANGGVEQITLTVSDGTLTLGSTTNVTDSGNGTDSVVFSGTIANLNNALAGLKYVPSNGFSGTDSLQVSIDDEGNTGTGGPQTTNAVLSLLVAPPIVTVSGGVTLNYTQGTTAGAIDPGLTLSDVTGEVTGATVAITGNFAAGQDVLGFSNTSKITGTYNASTGVLTLTGTDTLADYQTALESVTYADTSNDPSTQVRAIGFSISDGDTTSSVGTDDVTITAVNLAPTISHPGSEPVAENWPLVFSGANAITVGDVDANGGVERVSLSVSHGTLSLGSTSNVSATGNGTGTVVVSGTVPNLNTALAGLTYTPASGYVGTDTLGISIDDEGHSGTGGAKTMTGSLSLVVSAPLLSTTGGTTLSYTQQSAPGVIDSGINLTDAAGTLTGAIVAITGNFVSTEDVLGFTNTANISGSYNAATGVLTLSGSDTVADYQAALRSITYRDTSLNPSTATRTISFSFQDSRETSNTATDNVAVIAVNLPPTVTVPGAQSIGEGWPLVFSGTISVADSDADGGTEQVTLSASHGILTLGSTANLTVSGNGTGSVTASGTIANLNTGLNGLTYTPTSGYTGSDMISAGINDEGHTGTGGALTASATINVTISAPTLTATGGTTLNFSQGGSPAVIDSGLTISDAGSTISGATITITGNYTSNQDVLGFVNTSTITGSYSRGVLTLSGTDTVADYQAALRSVTYQDTSTDPTTTTRTVSFTYADPHASVNTVTDNVAVTPVNLAPTITIPAAGLTPENTALDLVITVADVDANGGIEQLTVSVSHGTVSIYTAGGGTFSNGSSGSTVVFSGTISQLNTDLSGSTYTPTTGYSGTDTLQLTINNEKTSSNGGNRTATASFPIYVVAPTVTTTGGTTLDYNTSSPAGVIDSGLTLTDEKGTIWGATVSVSSNFVSGQDVLGFTNQNGITGSYNSSSGVLSLTGQTSVQAYQTALESVTYQDTSSSPNTATRTISFSFEDENEDLASNTATDNVIVTTLTTANTAPTITVPGAQTLTENESLVFSGSKAISVADSTADGGMERLTLSASHGTLTLGSTSGLSGLLGNGGSSMTFVGTIANLNSALTGLTYTPTAGYTGSDTITVSINDDGYSGTGGAKTATATIGLTLSAPKVTTTGHTTLTYTQQAAAGVIDSGLTLSDGGGTITSATVAITSNFTSGQDVLGFTNTSTITGAYNASTGVLTLSGADTVADYQAALRSVTYEDTSLDPTTATRTVSFSFADAYNTSNTATDNVAVTQVNLPPTVTVGGSGSVAVGENWLTSLSGLFSVADVDANGGEEYIFLTASHGTFNVGTVSGLVVLDPNMANVTLEGTISLLNAGLNVLTYTPASNYVGSDTIGFTINDEGNTGTGGAQTATANVGVTVTAPSIATTGGTTLNYTQQSPAGAIDSGLTIADAGGTISGATVAITGNFAGSQDVLGFANTATITGSYNASTGVLTLSGTDTVADYQAALRSVTYEDTSLDPNTAARTIHFSYSDMHDSSNTATDTVTVTAVNLPPTITLPVSQPAPEDGSLVLSGANAISVADVDANGGVEQVTLSVSDGALTLGSTTNVTASGNGTDSVVFSGTIANLKSALAGLMYTPSNGFSGTDSLQVSIDDDGNTGTGGPQTTNATLSILVAPPIVTVSGGVTLNYTQGTPAGAIDPGLALSDTTGEVTGATVAITGNFAAAQDVLGFSNTSKITGTYNASTGVLTLSGTDTLADYQTALESVTYADTSADPSTQVRAIGFSISDGNSTSSLGTDDVTITAVNLAPTVSVPGTQSIYQNSVLILSGPSAITVGDVDANGGVEKVTLSAGNGTVTLGSTTNVTVSGNGTASVVVSGTIAELNAALDGLTYARSTGFVGTDTIQVSIDDEGNTGTGGAKTTSVSFNVVDRPYQAPTISGLGLAVTNGVPGVSSTTDPKITATLSDPDGNDPSYSAQIAWNGDSAPNATISVTPGSPFVYDLTGDVSPGSVTVYVRGVETTASGTLYGSWTPFTFQFDAAPVFGASSYAFNTNDQVSSGTVIGTVSATDADAGATITYSGSNGNSPFVINSSTGQVRFTGTSEPTAGTYQLVFQASDGLGSTATTDVTVTVTHVDLPPAVTNLGLVGTSGGVTSNPQMQITGTVVSVDGAGTSFSAQIDWTGDGTPDATVAATAGTPFNYSLAGDLSYGNVTVYVRGVETTASGTLYGNWTPFTFTNDAPPSFGSSSYTFTTTDQITAGSVIGTLTATDPNSGVTLSFSGPAEAFEPFAIGATTGQITYTGTTAPAAGTYEMVFNVSDGLGSVVSIPVAITVQIQHAVAENDTAQIAENATRTYNVLDHDEVPPTRTVTVAIVTAPGDGTATINGTNIVYTPNSSFVGTDSLVYSLTDDLGVVSTATLTLNVVADQAPVVNASTYSAYSGQTTDLNVLANDSDPAGNPLTIVSATTNLEGTVTVVPGADGAPDELAYTAPSWFIGTETITYVVSDPLGSTATTTATVNVSQLPAPVVTSFTLNDATGDPNALITSDPTVKGTVQSTLSDNQVQVQFSFDNGNTIGATTTANSDGSFVFDPSSDVSMGRVTIYARAVYLDSSGNVTLTGAWDALTFQWVAASYSGSDTGAATFTALSVTTDTTAEVVISGTTSLDTNGQTPSVQFDLTGDGVPDVTTSVGSGLSFSQSFTTNIGYNNQTIYARTVSGSGANTLYGAWQEITFYREPPPTTPPDLSDLALVDNTGTSTNPATTTALISGIATNPDGSLSAVTIQVDLNGDGTPDWSFQPTINSDGSFTVDLDPLLETDGSVTVALRAVTTDPATQEVLDGNWHSLTFQYSGNAAQEPQIPAVAVVNNVGTSSNPVTSDLQLSGVVQGPLSDYSWINVTVSLNGDNAPDATVAVNNLATGVFVVNLSGLGLEPGPVTAEFTATGWDTSKQETLSGNPIEFDFTYTPGTVQSPVVGSLQLVNDTDPADNTTSDPRVSGIATLNGQPLSEDPVEFELNNDQQPDGTFDTNSDGTFVFDPRDYGIQQGPVSLSFRAGVWNDQDGGYAYGAWQSISYTYQVPVQQTPTPTVSGLTLLSAPNTDGSYSNPIVGGSVTSSGSTDNLPVQFSVSDDGVPDGTVYTDSTGSGTFFVDLLPNLTTNGSYTVEFRAGAPDPNSGDVNYGSWVSITFSYEASQIGSGTPTLTRTSNIPISTSELDAGTQYASGAFNFTENTINPDGPPDSAISAPTSPGTAIIDGVLANAAANTPVNGGPVTTTVSNTDPGDGETTATTDTTTTNYTSNDYTAGGQELEIEHIKVATSIILTVTNSDGSGYQKTETDTYCELVETYLFGSDSYVYTNVSSNEQLTTKFWNTSGATIYNITETRTFTSNEDHVHEADDTQPGPLSAFDGQVDTTLLNTLADRPLFVSYDIDLSGDGDLDSLTESSSLTTSDGVGNTLSQTSQISLAVTTLAGAASTSQETWLTTYSEYEPINETLVTSPDPITTPLPNGSVQVTLNETQTLTGDEQITQNESGSSSVDDTGATITNWNGSSSDDLFETYSVNGTQTTVATLQGEDLYFGTYSATFQSVLTGSATQNTTNDSSQSVTGKWTAASGSNPVLSDWSGGSQTTNDANYSFTNSAVQTGTGSWNSDFVLASTASLTLDMVTNTTGDGSSSIVTTGTYALDGSQIDSDITTVGSAGSEETITIPTDVATSQNYSSFDSDSGDTWSSENATASGTETVTITIQTSSNQDDLNGVVTDSGSTTQNTKQTGTSVFAETTSGAGSSQTSLPQQESLSVEDQSSSSYGENDNTDDSSSATSSWVNGVYTTSATYQQNVSADYTLGDEQTEVTSVDDMPIPGGTENSSVTQDTNYGETGSTTSTTNGSLADGVNTASTNTIDITNFNWDNTLTTLANESYTVPVFDPNTGMSGTYTSESHDTETDNDTGSGVDNYQVQSVTTTADGSSSVSATSSETETQQGTTTETDTSGGTDSESASYGNDTTGGGETITGYSTMSSNIVTDYGSTSIVNTTSTPTSYSSTNSDSTFQTISETASTTAVTEQQENLWSPGFQELIVNSATAQSQISETSTSTSFTQGNNLLPQTYDNTTSDIETNRSDIFSNAESIYEAFNGSVATQGVLQGLAVDGYVLSTSLLVQTDTYDTSVKNTDVTQWQPGEFPLISATYVNLSSDEGDSSEGTSTQVQETTVNGRERYTASGTTGIKGLVEDSSTDISQPDGYRLNETDTYNSAAETNDQSADLWVGENGSNYQETNHVLESTSFDSDIQRQFAETSADGQLTSGNSSIFFTSGTTAENLAWIKTVYDLSENETDLQEQLSGTIMLESGVVNAAFQDTQTEETSYALGSSTAILTDTDTSSDSGTTVSCSDEILATNVTQENPALGLIESTTSTVNDHDHGSGYYDDTYSNTTITQRNPDGSSVVITHSGASGAENLDTATLSDSTTTVNQLTETIDMAYGTTFEFVTNTLTNGSTGNESALHELNTNWTLAGTTSTETFDDTNETGDSQTTTATLLKDFVNYQGPGITHVTSFTTETEVDYGYESDRNQLKINTDLSGQQTIDGMAVTELDIISYGSEEGYTDTDNSLQITSLSGAETEDSVSDESLQSNWYNTSVAIREAIYNGPITPTYSGWGQNQSYSDVNEQLATETTTTGYSVTLDAGQIIDVDTTTGSFVNASDDEYRASNEFETVNPGGSETYTQLDPVQGYVSKSVLQEQSGTVSDTNTVSTYVALDFQLYDYDTALGYTFQSGIGYTKTVYLDGSYDQVYSQSGDGFSAYWSYYQVRDDEGPGAMDTSTSLQTSSSYVNIAVDNSYHTNPEGVTQETSAWFDTTTSGTTYNLDTVLDQYMYDGPGTGQFVNVLGKDNIITLSGESAEADLYKWNEATTTYTYSNTEGTFNPGADDWNLSIYQFQSGTLFYQEYWSEQDSFNSEGPNDGQSGNTASTFTLTGQGSGVWQAIASGTETVDQYGGGGVPIAPQVSAGWTEGLSYNASYHGMATLGRGMFGPYNYAFQCTWLTLTTDGVQVAPGNPIPRVPIIFEQGYSYPSPNAEAAIPFMVDTEPYSFGPVPGQSGAFIASISPFDAEPGSVPSPDSLVLMQLNLTFFQFGVVQPPTLTTLTYQPMPKQPQLVQLQFFQPLANALQKFDGAYSPPNPAGNLLPIPGQPGLAAFFNTFDAFTYAQVAAGTVSEANVSGLAIHISGPGLSSQGYLMPPASVELDAYNLGQGAITIFPAVQQVIDYGQSQIRDIAGQSLTNVSDALAGSACFVAETPVFLGDAGAVVVQAQRNEAGVDDDASDGSELVIAMSAVPLGLLVTARARRRKASQEPDADEFLDNIWDDDLFDPLWSPPSMDSIEKPTATLCGSRQASTRTTLAENRDTGGSSSVGTSGSPAVACRSVEHTAPVAAGNPNRAAARRSRRTSFTLWFGAWMCLAAGLGWSLLHTGTTRGRHFAMAAVAPATPTPRTAPIAGVRIGQRVLADNPEIPSAQSGPLVIHNRSAWRRVTLEQRQANGGQLRVELLRPLSQIAAVSRPARKAIPPVVRSAIRGTLLAGSVSPALALPAGTAAAILQLANPKHELPLTDAALVGRKMVLGLPEFGAVGPATIVAVAPCPPLESGTGRLVTGRFRHQAATVLDLEIEAQTEPLGTTDYHPFWSDDRHAFVRAGDLRVGETLRTVSGGVTHVVKKTLRSVPQDVFNLEVEGAHCFYVSQSGVLVHNACSPVPQAVAIETGTRFVGTTNLATKELEDQGAVANGEPQQDFLRLLNVSTNDSGPYMGLLTADGNLPQAGYLGQGSALGAANGGQNALSQLQGDIDAIEQLFGADTTLMDVVGTLDSLPPFPFQ